MLYVTDGLMHILRGLYLLFSHISGSNSFLKPLEPAEEEYHLNRCALGCEDSKRILAEHNLRLVAHIVKKYNNCGKETDELISIGTDGLMKAIEKFNKDKNTRLATFAARCIENAILMDIRADKKTKKNISLKKPIGVDKEGNEVTIEDTLGTDPDAVFDQVELKMQIRKLYDKMKSTLTIREQMVLELRYGLLGGKISTQREIAEMLSISRSYVSRIEKRAITRLRKEFVHSSSHEKIE